MFRFYLFFSFWALVSQWCHNELVFWVFFFLHFVVLFVQLPTFGSFFFSVLLHPRINPSPQKPSCRSKSNLKLFEIIVNCFSYCNHNAYIYSKTIHPMNRNLYLCTKFLLFYTMILPKSVFSFIHVLVLIWWISIHF